MGHAILSPSGASRWMECPASIRAARGVEPGPESSYAREGTQFHTLCELTVRHRMLGGSDVDYLRDYLDWALGTVLEWRDAQLAYVEDWVLFLTGILEDDPGATLLLEQVVDTGVPGCWGTADVVIIHTDGRIRVIDIKYGAGMWVSCLDNPQLRLYGVGALNTLIEDPLTIHEITTTIWQPRMDNISDETLTRRELLKWRDELIPVAKLALGEDAPYGPSEDACRWCPIAGECKVRADYMLKRDFGNPDLLSGDELAEAFARTAELSQWLRDIGDEALKRAYEDAGSVPGFKVVLSGGRRGITNAEKAVDVLLKAGYEADKVYSRKPATLGELEKVVGSADKLQQVLGDLLVKSEGRLSLVPESDKREAADAIQSAKMDFADISNEGEA